MLNAADIFVDLFNNMRNEKTLNREFLLNEYDVDWLKSYCNKLDLSSFRFTQITSDAFKDLKNLKIHKQKFLLDWMALDARNF